MSYFCANSISIDKKNLMCKVKGGDNNVTPRSNYWSSYFSIGELIQEISGGMIQFTSRTDKNITIENLANKYNKLIKELTGMSSYDASDLPKTPKETLATYESYSDDHWNRKTVDQIIVILKDEEMLNKISELKNEFIQEVINIKLDKAKYIIKGINNDYVYKSTKRRLLLTNYPGFAKEFTKVKAEDILSHYSHSTYEILPASKKNEA